MPELPDIEMYLSAFRERVVGQPVQRIRVGSPFVVRSYQPKLGELEGKTVVGMRRLGKRVVFELSQAYFLVVHLMLAGRFVEQKPAAKLPPRVGLLALDFASATYVLTEASKKKRASVHALVGEEALAAHDAGGIDVLNCRLKTFAAALRHENHTLKRTLTDPRVLSGIGNAYSDEILHAAGLSPIKWTSRLSDAEIKHLFNMTRKVLKHWTKYLNAQRQGAFPNKVTAFRPEMAVHGKYKEPCPRCAAPVQRIVRGKREINYCAPCQTGGKLLADRALSRLLRGDWPKTLEAWDARMAVLKAGGTRKAVKKAAANKALANTLAVTPASAKRARTTRISAAKPTPLGRGRPPARPLLLLAHGAGAGSSSAWMQHWARLLSRVGEVVTFDYAYMQRGKGPPDRLDKLVLAHVAALQRARAQASAGGRRGAPKTVLVGKSMGGRVGCHVSLQVEVDALVCLGYPLVSSGKSKALRDEVLKALRTPVMFVQGTRDRMCPLPLLAEVRAAMAASSRLHVVETGDHSLLATKRWLKARQLSQPQLDEQTLAAVMEFVAATT